jgi:hypothetical protein
MTVVIRVPKASVKARRSSRILFAASADRILEKREREKPVYIQQERCTSI